MDSRTLTIRRPCPVELEVDRGGRQFFCEHCRKEVLVLANWTRAEVEAFIAAHRGASVCVSLRRDARGELVYADSPPPPAAIVPVARLRRRWWPEAAAAGVAATLAACAPHGRPPAIEGEKEEVSAHAPALEVVLPDQRPEPTQAPVVEGKRGEIEAPKPIIERGELRAPPETGHRPDPPKRASKPKQTQTPERPPHEFDILEGGLDL